MRLDEKLIYLRKKKGLTQLELAEDINISRQAVSRWESGMTIPSTDNLRCLGELYGVSIDYLLNDNIEVLDQAEVAGEVTLKLQIQAKNSVESPDQPETVEATPFESQIQEKNPIEGSVQFETTKETPPEPQPQARIKKYIILVICVLIFAVAGVLIYNSVVHRDSDNLDFGKMESENWETTGTESFSLDW